LLQQPFYQHQASLEQCQEALQIPMHTQMQHSLHFLPETKPVEQRATASAHFDFMINELINQFNVLLTAA
jgi:hypothetical protein